VTPLPDTVIRVENLEKRFGAFVAVRGVSFSVQKGEVFGFLGPNGSGKSTTIRMLCGLLTPTGGKGQVLGYDIVREAERIKEHIGYMSQKFSLYEDLTPLENLRFFLGIYDVPKNLWSERLEETLVTTGLKDVAHRLTAELPPGMKQRLALGCALLHKPPLLFLDEPTAGVDLLSRHRFWNFIKNLAAAGTTILVTTHYLDEARNCGRLILLGEGRIVAAGSPEEILSFASSSHPVTNLQEAFVYLMGRAKEEI